MSHFLGLRTVLYPATDLAAMKDWYTKALGFPPYFDEPFYVGFNVGGYELGLDPNAPPSTGGGQQIYWGVTDIEATVAFLQTLAATIDSPVENVGDGILVATLRDPFGNALGLIHNPHFTLPG